MPFSHHPTAPQIPSIVEWKDRIVGINSLWTERESFYHIYNAKEGDPVHRQVKNDCEACILATIGGNEQMLTDLYVSAKGRGNYDRRKPPVSYMIEGWLDAMGLLENTHIGCLDFYRTIRHERRRMQRERRAERRANNKERPTYVPDPPLETPDRSRQPSQYQPSQGDVEAEDEIDAEEEKAEIIEFYARRLSAMPSQQGIGAHRNDSRLSAHPAIRAHLVYDAPTGKYSRREPEVPPMPSGYQGQLGRSNTTISRDSRWDPSAWEQYRSDSPVSVDSRCNSREYRTNPATPASDRRRSKNATEYSDSVYSRAADNDINDSGYYESSSILSARDLHHEQNLRVYPTNADISTSPMPSEVARNRKDAYINLVGMPSAYEFEALAKHPLKQKGLKTLYEFEPYAGDELELSLEPEQKANIETKQANAKSRLESRREERQRSCGRTNPQDEEGTANAEQERRTTQWGDLYTLQENDERCGGNGRKPRDKKHVDADRKMKQKGRGK